ncbi:MAG: class I SAM-dependent methyltransferase [Methanoregula sp.]|uniref:class I SAM-dependent methyltransferase n=1 Tax=Methanoregula sp. TaxID=2052170 RepID=UPI003BAF8108
MKKGKDYVHGYSSREAERLLDQAQTLTDLLHHDTRYPAGSRVLEAGCGVGAQTVMLAAGSPDASFTCIDCSEKSLAEAEAWIQKTGHKNVVFQKADIFNLPFPPASFDHVFVCFVLEHLTDPAGALYNLKNMLKPGGTITVIEGDHGSAYFHPDSVYARDAISCLVTLQKEAGGNALVGRELYPLLTRSGFSQVSVSPRMVYVDASRPALVEGFTKLTFTAMVEGVREEALFRGMMTGSDWDRGIADLYRTCEPDGVFCYTFFKAIGVRK